MDPEKVNLNGHKEEKKINIFSCYNDSTQTLHYNATKCYEIDVENILPISNQNKEGIFFPENKAVLL